ncbi:HLA class II histocompatibility antigen, DQ alpha 2 chain-like [Lampris incognitus]|uniref:HLA class II histocompatibility antigen, DQ alpha 2 chain-like n=1 Tax=Lampris incognitus TaxID=2546036 RepID=UPI0024B59C9A|nr:HLA class II histocompatibility antigen, DQ alpha 2 chain-like [Lampris incognitus]
MKCFSIAALILSFFCVPAQTFHELQYLISCYSNGSEIHATLDDEQIFYVDFQTRKLVGTLAPLFDQSSITFDPTTQFHIALKYKTYCEELLIYLIAEEKNPSWQKDAPESTIYSLDEIELGRENSLICFVNSFYPPSIQVHWVKNGYPVAEGASLSRYYLNDDGTFHQFSTLTFTPSKGDVYSCTVEHTALEQPITATWELKPRLPIFGPDIFCGAGAALGVLGVAVGTVLIVKACNEQ